MADVDEPRRGRRAAEETQRRRRRGQSDLGASRKMDIPPEAQEYLDAHNLVPRWANDEGNRIERLTKHDDYDPVPNVPPVPVGTDAAGKPIMAHLLAKPRKFFDADQREADNRRKAQEKAFVADPTEATRAGRGNNPNPGGSAHYVAEGTKIETNRRGGNQILDG